MSTEPGPKTPAAAAPEMDPAFETQEPAGLYLHVPYCSAVCPYCDFAVRRGDGDRADAFAEVLIREIRDVASGAVAPPDDPAPSRALGRLATSTFDTVYLGGGTPSLLGGDPLAEVLGAVTDVFDLDPGARLFFEANPENVDDPRLARWRDLGVSVLSLGVQSFDDGELKFLGRRHSGREAVVAVERALAAGLGTVSVDLIYGLPDQTLEGWSRSLEQAIALGPDHLSLYELEVNEGTPFFKQRRRGELTELDEDLQAELFHHTHTRLGEAGFESYEACSFARAPRHRSRHNGKYWRHAPYLGLGPSAHSFAAGVRMWNERLEPRWRKRVNAGQSAVAGFESLTAEGFILEALMLGLRTMGGVDLGDLRRRTGIDLATPNRDRIERWRDAGWLHEGDGPHLRPTRLGLAVADRLATELSVP
ncbi:MAG: radical SAM family heme chaperone HemW [Acidobacteriota bacterium]